MKRNIFKDKGFWISSAVCLLPILLSAICYNSLPDQVATHFDVNFSPDGYSPKWQAAFMIPGIMFLVNIFLWFMIENDPKNASINKTLKAFLHWFIPVLSVFTQASILLYALDNTINLIRILPLLIGIMLIFIGNYLPKCKQNYTTGIKLPWTLSSEENWNRTHRFGGKVMVICGFIIALCTFWKISIIIIISALLACALAPAIYSYVLYKKGI